MTSNERATTMAIVMTATTTGMRTEATSRAARKLAAARSALLAGAMAVGVLAVTGCSLDSILKNDELPPDVTDPAITKTREGAIAAYHGLIHRFGTSFGGSQSASYVAFGGRLADELRQGGHALGGDLLDPVDSRAMPEGVQDYELLDAFGSLQRVRGQASQAIGLLTRYASDEIAITGHAYTLNAYAEIFLAELFCSGIPLSTLDFDGDFTPRRGSPTEEVYAHALALLDTALTIVGDSASFVHLARMAQARALLGLGDLEGAAAAVAEIPEDWEYAIGYLSDAEFSNFAIVSLPSDPWGFTVADAEGENGLDYISSGDPRTASTRTLTNQYGHGIYFPDKYRAPLAPDASRADTLAAMNGSMPIVLASGVEARLITAEADLAAGGTEWLDILNALRTDGTFTTTSAPTPTDPAHEDTLWHAGIGGVDGLAPLVDPGEVDARVDLVFRERAFWLFLTGHRQADMRRLVRQYGRSETDVYPVGAYPSSNGFSYGSDVNAPIPVEEGVSNPHFTGCISRGA